MGLREAQEFMRGRGIDGWLVFDFHGSNPVLGRVLGGAPGHLTRRVFAWVPAEGEPSVLGSAVDKGQFEDVALKLVTYTDRHSLVSELRDLLGEARTVAMEYAPGGTLPYASRVDAGTVDMVRGLGKNVVSSADLYQYAFARLSASELESHRKAAALLEEGKNATFAHVFSEVLAGRRITEYEAQQHLVGFFEERGLVTDHPPIVAANAHAGDPHYAPRAEGSAVLKRGDWVLIDLWAKLRERGAVFADVTWMGFAGPAEEIPKRNLAVFEAVRDARDEGVRFLEARHKAGVATTGAQLDEVVRGHLKEQGLAEWFVHRTGHSVGESVHADGANVDSFETYDTRELLPGLLFTIEPGVYLPEFGVRSEIDVFIHAERRPEVTTPAQRDVVTPS